MPDISGTYYAWGTDPIVTSPARINVVSISSLKRVLGFDRPVGYLANDGIVHTFDGTQCPEKWEDVAIIGLGAVYAFKGELMAVQADDRGTLQVRFV